MSDEIYKGIILRFYKDHNSCYGAKRVYELLKNDNYKISKRRVARLYKELGLKSKAEKKWKNTTNSKHNKLVADNLLKQDFKAENPNEKWVSDITYIWTKEGWLYLCVIMDLYSRKIVGWSMDKRMKDDLVCNALLNALFSRGHPKGVIIHSDRGSQYCSYKFSNLVKKHGLISSMSSTGCCYDNAACESFFHSMKLEECDDYNYKTRQEARTSIFKYIETFYNKKRLHSYINYCSPNDFESKIRTHKKVSQIRG